jgi:hypothetical protein
MISHLGSLVSVVAGALFARRLKGTLGDSVGATSIGDGGTSTGAFHEGMNMAAVEKLPLVVSIANNQYAYSTPTNRQFACENLVDRAKGYGVEGYSIDGTDLLACVITFRTAFQRARAGHGPRSSWAVSSASAATASMMTPLIYLTSRSTSTKAETVSPSPRSRPLPMAGPVRQNSINGIKAARREVDQATSWS